MLDGRLVHHTSDASARTVAFDSYLSYMDFRVVLAEFKWEVFIIR